MIIANPSSRTLAELPILKSQGITSIKIYMTYDALRLNDTQFLDVLLACREHKITTLVHAENDSVITWMTKKLEEKRLFDPKYHGLAHTPMAEIEATFRAICFSELLDTPILIVHVSNGRATESIRQAQANGLPIYAETCPQYLFLSHQHVDVPGFEGAKFICSPPLRDSSEHEKIWTGLEDGTFTILSSDHSPFKFNDACGKMSTVDDEHPNGHFKHIPNGFSGVETRLATVFSANRLSLYGMYPKKGALEPGLSDADIVVWYPEPGLDIKITNHMLHHNVDYTPFEGHKVSQWPRYTILRGEVVWDRENGGVLAEPGYGSFVKRSESQLQGSRDLGAWNLETEF
jgi:dihydropyrimidinase